MGVVAVATRTFSLHHDQARRVTICRQLDRNARVRHPMSMLKYIYSLVLLNREGNSQEERNSAKAHEA